jgi:hypothetical protein
MARGLKVLAGVGLALLLVVPLTGQAVAPVVAPSQHPGFFRQYAPGLLARVNYEAPPGGRHRVALWDLLVGPGKASDPVKLPGGAVVEVRSGSGRAVIDGQAREIAGGATFVVHQGSSLALANGRDDLALALRVTLISAGPR